MASLTGDAGNNLLEGGSGKDRIRGLDGDDTLDGGIGADTLVGGNGRDVLRPGSDNAVDVVSGGVGDDFVSGARSGDQLDGGSGYDLLFLSLDGAGAPLNEDLSAVGSRTAYTFADGTSIVGFEYLDLTLTSGDDILHAPKFYAFIYGEAGADDLIGNGVGNYLDGGEFDLDPDTMFGAGGDDTLVGGIGDVFNGGAGNDEVEIWLTQSPTGLDLDLSRLAAGKKVVLDDGTTLIGVERGILYASLHDDIIRIGDTGFTISTGAGDDKLIGGAGDTVFIPGQGNDTVKGGDGVDTLTYIYSVNSGVTIDLRIRGEQDTGGGGLETISGIESVTGTNGYGDRLTGDDGANTLMGWGGDDILRGQGGDDSLVSGYAMDADTLVGGFGRDTLTGGGGVDTFVFSDLDHSPFKGSDLITDLALEDKIDLRGIDANSSKDGDQAFELVSSVGAGKGEMTLSYADGVTSLALYVNGDGKADSVITISGDLTGFSNFLG